MSDEYDLHNLGEQVANSLGIHCPITCDWNWIMGPMVAAMRAKGWHPDLNLIDNFVAFEHSGSVSDGYEDFSECADDTAIRRAVLIAAAKAIQE